jgi:X-X-X-Leu-X-X-Gly heptad repeat protein
MEYKGLWTLAGYATMGIVLGYKIHQLSDKTDQLSDEIHRLADETYGLNQTIRLRMLR